MARWSKEYPRKRPANGNVSIIFNAFKGKIINIFIKYRYHVSRLILFQARFDELWERFQTFSSGEALFGIEVTDYPVLHQRKRELSLLQKLYTLYLQVMRTIDSYYDIPWAEIDIESIITELADFQNR